MFHKTNGTNEKVFPQGFNLFQSHTYDVLPITLKPLNKVTVALGTQNFGFKKFPEVLCQYTISLTSSGNISWMSYARNA